MSYETQERRVFSVCALMMVAGVAFLLLAAFGVISNAHEDDNEVGFPPAPIYLGDPGDDTPTCIPEGEPGFDPDCIHISNDDPCIDRGFPREPCIGGKKGNLLDTDEAEGWIIEGSTDITWVEPKEAFTMLVRDGYGMRCVMANLWDAPDSVSCFPLADILGCFTPEDREFSLCDVQLGHVIGGGVPDRKEPQCYLGDWRKPEPYFPGDSIKWRVVPQTELLPPNN